MIPMQDVAYQELVEAGKSSSPSQSKYDTTAADASLKVANTLKKLTHAGVTSHWTYRVYMQDGRSFAIDLTGRRLGWIRLV
jgi:hypothetical protein